jgi:hypothetical protein
MGGGFFDHEDEEEDEEKAEGVHLRTRDIQFPSQRPTRLATSDTPVVQSNPRNVNGTFHFGEVSLQNLFRNSPCPSR